MLKRTDQLAQTTSVFIDVLREQQIRANVSTSPTSTQRPVIGNYASQIGIYDEFVGHDGQPRPHLRKFHDTLNSMGCDEFSRRWEQTQRTVQENGFAYSGHGAGNSKPRPWEVDPLPLLISASEWDDVSAALIQRARVLNLTLADLFGEQRLIKSGVLPRELLFNHPGFLRPCFGQSQPGGYLHFYAADLARGADGSWTVLADRTEAPSGLGYALENRIVISRMLPDVFAACQVKRLAPFFIAVQKMLRRLAPRHRENPYVVLLSHGPTSANFFEDAYLARYLGITLVEDGDLTVRSGQVLLKTLDGLVAVDVVLRRQNSSECDPLEMGAASVLGVAGLTHATRAAKVGIANALGSGLVESPAVTSFLPQLCRAIEGEELLMQSVPAWWCGQTEALSRVLDNLDDLTIHPAFRQRGHDGTTRERLTNSSTQELADVIRRDPGSYVAQQRVARSTMPVWGDDQLAPAHLALRAYVVWDGEDYTVLQGALARSSKSLEPLDISIRRGEGSKDVWILSDQPVERVSLLDAPDHSIVLKRIGGELPSRSADDILWLGRQMERAESVARLLRAAADRMSGETRATSAVELPLLLRCLADLGQIEPAYAVEPMKEQMPAIDRALPRIVFDRNQGTGLRSILDELYRLGTMVRDRVSQDTWRIIHRIDEGFQPKKRGTGNLSDLLAMTDQVIADLAALSGIVTDSMTRTHAFRFLELGRRLERSWQIIGLLRNFFVPMPKSHGPAFETILEVADSLMTYRSRYLSNLQFAAVVDLLLTDETNPRSLAYQFLKLADHVEKLPRIQMQPGYTAEQRAAMSLLHSIRQVDIHAVAEAHTLGQTEPFETLLSDWEELLPRLFDAISHRYLVHAVPAHQLSELSPQQIAAREE